MAAFSASSAVVVNSTHSTAIAIPTETLPCSNSRMIYVDTTSVLGGAIRLAVTSSRKAIIKVIIQPVAIPGLISGSVICRKIYSGLPPNTRPAAIRLSLICVNEDVTYCTVYGKKSTT